MDIKEVLETPEVNLCQKGPRLNHLYSEWSIAGSANKKYFESLLFQEIRDYAIRCIRQSTPKLQSWEDAAQESTLEIWSCLGKFDNTSDTKFSTWVYSIIDHTKVDFIRRIFTNKKYAGVERRPQKREIELLEWKGYDDSGSSKLAATPTLSQRDGDEIEGDDSPSGRQDVLSKGYVEATENKIINQIDSQKSIQNLDKLIQNLSREDQFLLRLLREGYDSVKVAKALHQTPKQIYNKYSRIKRVLRDDITAIPCYLHRCTRSFESHYVLQAGRYINGNGKSYQRLPGSCRCKKIITRVQARKLIDTGEAMRTYHLQKGKPVIDYAHVWAARNVRTCRATVSGKVHIERMIDGRRQDKSDIDIAMQMNSDFINRLIVSPKEMQERGINPAHPDPFEGRAITADWTDKRTKGSQRNISWEPNPRKPDPWIVISSLRRDGSRGKCPGCPNGLLIISVDAAGYQKSECNNEGNKYACTYLMVWRKKDLSNKQSSNEEVLNSHLFQGATPAPLSNEPSQKWLGSSFGSCPAFS